MKFKQNIKKEKIPNHRTVFAVKLSLSAGFPYFYIVLRYTRVVKSYLACLFSEKKKKKDIIKVEQ